MGTVYCRLIRAVAKSSTIPKKICKWVIEIKRSTLLPGSMPMKLPMLVKATVCQLNSPHTLYMVSKRSTTVSTKIKMMAHYTGIIIANSGVATRAKPKPETVAKNEPIKMMRPASVKLYKSIETASPSQSATLTAPPEGSHSYIVAYP